jgi:hypothetical protein
MSATWLARMIVRARTTWKFNTTWQARTTWKSVTNRRPIKTRSQRTPEDSRHAKRLSSTGYIANVFSLFLTAELVDQRTDQPGICGVQRCDQVRTVLSAVDRFTHARENVFLNLLIQLSAVSDDQDASITDVFTNPFCQPDHHQAFA